jgi:hypothetical protein
MSVILSVAKDLNRTMIAMQKMRWGTRTGAKA